MFKEELVKILKQAGVSDEMDFSTPPKSEMGDLAFACFGLAKKQKKNPAEVARELAGVISKSIGDDKFIITKAQAFGPYVNFYLNGAVLARLVLDEINEQQERYGKNETGKGKTIMVEFAHPNNHKAFHIGHLRNLITGESLVRILENSGHRVVRANYQGDVGLHVAKAIWGLQKDKKLQDQSYSNVIQATNIGLAYAEGSQAYEDDPKAKSEIDEINKKIYNKDDKKINEIYDWGFKVTMEAFEDLYKILGTEFNFSFLESQMAEIGERIVKDNLDKFIDSPKSKMIFEKSDDAIVFKAEKHDPKLHTRVFITREGLPTYETKELGLTEEKFKTDPDMDLSIVITANEQAEYMKVVGKAISLIHPEHEKKMFHITHGMMRFAEGKMGSRKGNVITGESLIRETIELIKEKMRERDWDEEEKSKIAEMVGVASIKYSILRSTSGSDIVFNREESISTEGDSGPYLQYSYARANSVLEKAKLEDILPDPHAYPPEIFEVEKLLYKFPEVVLRSSSEYEPHYIANYLIEVARAFNSFYGNNLIVDKADKTSSYKVALTYAFTFVMKKGLHLLGIKAPGKM